jgi:hypothetical protein
VEWRPETIAAAAGILRRDYADRSNYDIARAVWSTAARKKPALGGILLVHEARKELEAEKERLGRAATIRNDHSANV